MATEIPIQNTVLLKKNKTIIKTIVLLLIITLTGCKYDPVGQEEFVCPICYKPTAQIHDESNSASYSGFRMKCSSCKAAFVRWTIL